MADAIDVTRLPQSALLDTSVLVPALDKTKVRKWDDPASAPLFEAMVSSRRTVLIAAPSVTELLRRSPTSAIPRERYVMVVAFDYQAAEVLATKFPPSVLKTLRDRHKRPLDYIKYDAMILACAVRHRVAAFVSCDVVQCALANEVGLSVRKPSDYLDPQTKIPGT